MRHTQNFMKKKDHATEGGTGFGGMNGTGIHRMNSMGIRPWDKEWDTGQRYLAAGLYIAARRALESAESAAFAQRDAASLERIYLPLLEACRQMRLQACQGAIAIGHPRQTTNYLPVRKFIENAEAGTLLLGGTGAVRIASRLIRRARCAGQAKEALIWSLRGTRIRLCATAAPRFTNGVEAQFAVDPQAKITPEMLEKQLLLLPPPGIYAPGSPGHDLAKESLLVGWEWLALRWQFCHLVKARPWDELAWLRATREVDPACEPVMMRMVEICRLLAKMN